MVTPDNADSPAHAASRRSFVREALLTSAFSLSTLGAGAQSGPPTPAGLMEGFSRRRIPGDGITVDALVGGSGPPLLLLHGFPQTRLCWAAVAPTLAKHFTVVIPDLRGYGRSDKPPGDADHVNYSKRTLANDQLATMKALGFARFAVAGHDRGGRVAYRLALDYPESISKIAVLDVLPTSVAYARIVAASAVKAWHWFFMLQENGLAEKMIGAASEAYVRSFLKVPAGSAYTFDSRSVTDYIGCFRDPAAIHGACEDYRAAWHVDRLLDEEQQGKVKLAMPTLVLWGDQGAIAQSEPLRVWREWAVDVQGHACPSGHFIPEEAPDHIIEAFQQFFST